MARVTSPRSRGSWLAEQGPVVTIGDEVSAPETPAAASLSPSPIAPPTATRTRRRRRPSGAPPPLPKHIGTTGTGWLVAFVVLLLWAVLAHNFVAVGRVTDRFDSAILRQVREGAHGLAHERRRRRRERLLVVARDPGLARAHGPLDGVQALAAPVHPARLHVPAAGHRADDVAKLHAAAAVRCHDIGHWEGWSFPAPGIAFAALCVDRVRRTRWWCPDVRARSPSASLLRSLLSGRSAALYLATFGPFDHRDGHRLAGRSRCERLSHLHAQ